jgi:hypothetical protein
MTMRYAHLPPGSGGEHIKVLEKRRVHGNATAKGTI